MTTQTIAILAVLVAGFVVLGALLVRQSRPSDASAAVNAAVNEGLKALIATNETQRTSTNEAVNLQLETVRKAIEDLKTQSNGWDKDRSDAIGALRTVAETTQAQVARLNEETAGLSGAMRGTQTRGQWGEVSLRNVIESVGMIKYVDFVEQVQEVGEGSGIPDVTVTLPGGKVMYIDSKVPWAKYQESLGQSDPELREALLKENARLVRGHIDKLASRNYQRSQASTSFVVMFVPVESVLSSAMVYDPDLIKYATSKKIVLTSVASLIVILSNFQQAWAAQVRMEGVDKIVQTSDELVKRIEKMITHMDKIGDGMRTASKAYNEMVSSYNSRVVPQATKLYGLKGHDVVIEDLDTVEFDPKHLRNAARDADKGKVEEIEVPEEDVEADDQD